MYFFPKQTTQVLNLHRLSCTSSYSFTAGFLILSCFKYIFTAFGKSIHNTFWPLKKKEDQRDPFFLPMLKQSKNSSICSSIYLRCFFRAIHAVSSNMKMEITSKGKLTFINFQVVFNLHFLFHLETIKKSSLTSTRSLHLACLHIALSNLQRSISLTYELSSPSPHEYF